MISSCPYVEGDRVRMRYGMATVTGIIKQPRHVGYLLEVVTDLGQYWFASQEEIERLNPELPISV